MEDNKWEKNMATKRLFLDDERVPIDCAKYMYTRGVDCRIYHEEWIIVRSYKQFTDYITINGLPDVISFDHDLADVFQSKETLDIHEWFDAKGNREYTGMNCAQWLVNYCLDNGKILPRFIVHSMNPVGRENIEGLLNNFIKNESTKH